MGLESGRPCVQCGEPAKGDEFCSAGCARLFHGTAPHQETRSYEPKLTAKQLAAIEASNERRARLARAQGAESTLEDRRADVRRTAAEIEQVFGDWPRCEEPSCGRRHPPRRSKKTGELARFCSETCYQRWYHRQHRDDHLAKMKDRYRRQREAVAA